MSEDNYRTICSVLGLVIGLGIMFASGWGGMIPGAIFGAGGAVAGGIIGEKLFARKHR
jgi:outer membrane lipoprotein SlyB